MTTSQATSDLVLKAPVEVQVYVAEDGIRWRIRSSSRGKRIISLAPQGYSSKAGAWRALLLTTGGTYVQVFRAVYKDGVLEQGSILRRTPEGPVEDIFVQYLSRVVPS